MNLKFAFEFTCLQCAKSHIHLIYHDRILIELECCKSYIYSVNHDFFTDLAENSHFKTLSFIKKLKKEDFL